MRFRPATRPAQGHEWADILNHPKITEEIRALLSRIKENGSVEHDGVSTYYTVTKTNLFLRDAGFLFRVWKTVYGDWKNKQRGSFGFVRVEPEIQ
jgi:hypothetical protein